MNTKNIIGIVLIIIVLGIGGWKIMWTSSNQPVAPYTTNNIPESKIPETNTTNPNTSETQSSTEVTTEKNTFTMSEIAKHNNAVSCYTTINGGVYDLTNWINQHPGGEGAILSICGIDGSNAFNGQHDGQGKPERMLATFKIGTLTK